MSNTSKIKDRHFGYLNYFGNFKEFVDKLNETKDFEIKEINVFCGENNFKTNIKELNFLNIKDIDKVIVKGLYKDKIIDLCIIENKIYVLGEKRKKTNSFIKKIVGF